MIYRRRVGPVHPARPLQSSLSDGCWANESFIGARPPKRQWSEGILFGGSTSWVMFVSSHSLTRTVLAIRLDGYCQLGDGTLATYDEKLRWVSPVLDASFYCSCFPSYETDTVFVPLSRCKALLSFSFLRLLRRVLRLPVTQPVFPNDLTHGVLSLTSLVGVCCVLCLAFR